MSVTIYLVPEDNGEKSLWVLLFAPGADDQHLSRGRVKLSPALGAISSHESEKSVCSLISVLLGQFEGGATMTELTSSRAFMEVAEIARRQYSEGTVFPIKLTFSIEYNLSVDTMTETVVSVPSEGGTYEDKIHYSRQPSELGTLKAMFDGGGHIRSSLEFEIAPPFTEIYYDDILLGATSTLDDVGGLSGDFYESVGYEGVNLNVHKDNPTEPFDIDRYASSIEIILSSKAVELDTDLASFTAIAADDSVQFCGFEKDQ